MLPRRAASALLVLVACGAPASAPSAPPPPPPEPPLPGTPADAGVASTPPAPSPTASAAPLVEPCPASLVEMVTRLPVACRTQGKTCSYDAPAGSCACEVTTSTAQCGGVETPRVQGLRWQCRLSKPEAATREDGCPLLAPKNGASCTGTRKCAWQAQGPCARDQISATCVSGRWKAETAYGIAPP